MLVNIPTTLIAGSLGAGKTSVLRHWLANKPADERWAVLINEFGQIGLDAALLEGSGQGAQLAEVAGGCVCCVNGAPLTVTLSRLLRQAQPQRLFIETSGLGHPAALAAQLAAPPWQGVLALQPVCVVLDAERLQRNEPLSEQLEDCLASAAPLLINKSELLSAAERQAVQARFANAQLISHGQTPCPAVLKPAQAGKPVLPNAGMQRGEVWLDPGQPIVAVQQRAEGWSIGWRWHPSQRFNLSALRDWLQGLGYLRAKGIVQTAEGAAACNLTPGQVIDWQPSPWRRDSRLELIFSQPQDAPALSQSLRQCCASQA